MADLTDRVAIVTGAGSGLGRAAAVAFARAGAAVVLNDVDARGLEETQELIAASSGRSARHVGDVASRESVTQMVSVAEREFGGVDIMHANAAVSLYRDFEAMSAADFDRILAVNLAGALLCAQAAITPMRRRGGGSIIFVSSVQGYQGLPGCVVYAAAKAGLIAAARTLSVEVGRYGIRVNALVPGTIDTPMLERDLEPMNGDERKEFVARVESANALRRIGHPEEVAKAAVFLASDDAAYTTGSALLVDGGFLAVKSF